MSCASSTIFFFYLNAAHKGSDDVERLRDSDGAIIWLRINDSQASVPCGSGATWRHCRTGRVRVRRYRHGASQGLRAADGGLQRRSHVDTTRGGARVSVPDLGLDVTQRKAPHVAGTCRVSLHCPLSKYLPCHTPPIVRQCGTLRLPLVGTNDHPTALNSPGNGLRSFSDDS